MRRDGGGGMRERGGRKRGRMERWGRGGVGREKGDNVGERRSKGGIGLWVGIKG